MTLLTRRPRRPRRRPLASICLPPARLRAPPRPAPHRPPHCPPHIPPSPPKQEDATEHVGEVLERVKPEYLRRAYKLQSWGDAEDFLAQVARTTGEPGGGQV